MDSRRIPPKLSAKTDFRFFSRKNGFGVDVGRVTSLSVAKYENLKNGNFHTGDIKNLFWARPSWNSPGIHRVTLREANLKKSRKKPRQKNF